MEEGEGGEASGGGEEEAEGGQRGVVEDMGEDGGGGGGGDFEGGRHCTLCVCSSGCLREWKRGAAERRRGRGFVFVDLNFI